MNRERGGKEQRRSREGRGGENERDRAKEKTEKPIEREANK
jgi:hypothetical protein